MKKIKQAFYVVVMFILIILSVYYLGIFVRPTDTDSSFSAIDTFHDMPEDSIEVIGYGSSCMWKGINPITMYENYGVGMYNYGCNWQHFNTTYLFFLDSLQTQSPDVVIFEVKNVYNLLEDVDMGGEIYYTTALDGWMMKSEYLYQCFDNVLERYVSYILPVFGFHENWKNLSENSLELNSSNSNFYATMGYSGSTSVQSVEGVDSTTFEELELPESSIEILDDIVEICEEDDIEIIFYVAPYARQYKYSDAMAEYAQANGCTYFDFFEYMDELGIDWETDFRDKNHLNDSGAEKISNFLGEYIATNYDVTDMRTVEDNLWESSSND